MQEPKPFPALTGAASPCSGKLLSSPGPHLHITAPWWVTPSLLYPAQILHTDVRALKITLPGFVSKFFLFINHVTLNKLLSPQCPGLLMHKMRTMVLCGRMVNYLISVSECCLQSYPGRSGWLGKLQQTKLTWFAISFSSKVEPLEDAWWPFWIHSETIV